MGGKEDLYLWLGLLYSVMTVAFPSYQCDLLSLDLVDTLTVDKAKY